jgi:hypothetical protein
MTLSTFTTGIAGLLVAYVGLAVVLLSIHIYSNWTAWVKSAVTVLGIGLCVVAYNSYPKITGWPVTSDSLPSRIYLLAIEIVEPDSIFLWARDLDQGLGFTPPRAYELPYSKLLHQHAEKARGRLKRGIAVIAEIEPAEGGRAEVSEDDAVVVKSSRIRFVDAPQGLVPQKE